MKNVAIQNLERQGHTVTVSDLYGQGFSAVAQKWDFVATSGGHFNYMLEQKHSAQLQNAFSPDILAEIQKLQAADVLLIITPLWWSSVPAILKGWFDRVLAMGVAWDSGKIYENGLMRGKQAMLAVAGGHPTEYYTKNGRHTIEPDKVLHHINHDTLAFCGFNVQEPYIALDILGLNKSQLDEALNSWRTKAQSFVASPLWLTYYG